jgi:uncharacterized membrane protein
LKLQRLELFVAALWWGSLTTLGFGVVPLLFARLGSPAQAGQMAAQLFSAQTWVSVVCGLLLLMALRRRNQAQGLGWILAGMLLALLVELAVAPRIVARENLALWHSLGTAMYALQWLCAGACLWRQAKPSA